jgi:hypothetical protein
MATTPFPPPLPTAESLIRNIEQGLQALLDAEPGTLVRVPRCFLTHWLQQLDRVRRLLPDEE